MAFIGHIDILPMIPMNHISLFSGIGGFDLAGEMAGINPILQVELDDYPFSILEKRWPNVQKIRDVRNVENEIGTHKFDNGNLVITGGFPCQPFSIAGKRRGTEDNRFLWNEMLSVITRFRPAWVIGENVTGIISMALDEILFGMENNGYSVRVFVFPACSVGAPHKRERIFVVGHANRGGEHGPTVNDETSMLPGVYPDAAIKRLEGFEREGLYGEGNGFTDIYGGGWEIEPGICRMADGVSHRMDRLKCLGNAVVPQQVYPILKSISIING